MKIIATIEARLTSSRLPGKIMMQAAGKPMLEFLVDRLRAVSSIDDIVFFVIYLINNNIKLNTTPTINPKNTNKVEIIK